MKVLLTYSKILTIITKLLASVCCSLQLIVDVIIKIARFHSQLQ